MKIYQEEKKLQKREQCLKVRNKNDVDKSRFEINKRSGLNHRRKQQQAKNDKVKNLELKVKIFENFNRRLKRRLNTTIRVNSTEESFSDAGTSSSTVLECVLECVLSPIPSPIGVNPVCLMQLTVNVQYNVT